MKRTYRVVSTLLLLAASLHGRAEEAVDGLALRFKAELEALRSEDPAERESGLKRLVAEGPAVLPKIRAQAAVETDAEASALLRSAPDLIDFEELRKDRWVEVAAPEPVPGSTDEYCLSPNGTLLATTGWDRKVIVYRTEDLKLVRAFEVPEGERTSTVGFSEDSEWVGVVGSSAHVWSVREGAEVSGWHRSRVTRESMYERDDGGLLLAADRKLLVVRKSLPTTLPEGLARVEGGTAIAAFYEADAPGFWTGPPAMGFQGLGISVIDPLGAAESRQREWKSREGRRDAFPFAGLQIAGDRFGYTTEGKVHVCRVSDCEEEQCFGSEVTCLARSGATWITGHKDGTLRTWSAGKEMSCLDLRSGRAWSVLASENLIWVSLEESSLLVVRASGVRIEVPRDVRPALDASGACCLDGPRFRAWDNSGRERSVAVPGLSTRAWKFSRRDGRVLIDNRDDLRLYDEKDGHLLGSVNGHRGCADSIEWCGTKLVCHVRNGPSYLLDPDGDVSRAALLPESTFCSEGQFIDLRRYEITPRQQPVFSSDRSTIAFETREGECVMRESDGTILCEADHRGDAWLSPDGGRLALVGWGTGDGWNKGITWSIWDTRSGKCILKTQLPEDRSDTHVEFAPDGRIGLFGNRLRIFDASGALVHHEFDDPGEAPFCPEGLAGASMSPDGSRLVLQSRRGGFRLEDTSTWEQLVDEPPQDRLPERTVKLRWSPGGRRIALYRNGYLWWIPAGGGPAGAPSLRPGGANQNEDRELFDFLPDGHLAVVSEDGLEILHQATGRIAVSVPGVKGTMLRVSADGRWIAILSSSRVRLFRRSSR